MPFDNCRVIQIIPAAAAWRAIFADENEEGLVLEADLVGWAFIERDGTPAVVGLHATGEVENCEALENFLGYAAPGQPASQWHHDAVRFFREQHRRS
jgi:hypothetical protein